MKKIALVALMIGGLAFGQTKKVVSSDVHWWGYKVAKSEASSHDGTINVKSGNIEVKGNKVVNGSFILDMTTISATDLTGEYKTKLDDHLKNGDFFEVDKYPAAKFVITSILPKKNDKEFNSIVKGNLTVKDKTNVISFPAKVAVEKDQVTLESGKFTIDRQKFNVAYKSAIKDVFVKDDIELKVKVTAR